MSIRENVVSSLVKEIISLGSNSSSSKLDDETLEKMMKDVDISQAIQLMTQTITSKEWKIQTDFVEYEKMSEQIQQRFNNFNMVKLLENVLRAEVHKKSLFEIIYGKDEAGNTVINDLVLLPNKYIKYDKDNGWMVKTRDSEIVIANEPNRFLICVNDERLDNFQGSCDLEPLVNVFNAKNNIESKFNAIIEKYGDIITVFAYEPALETDSADIKRARQKDVEAQAKSLKEAKGKDVLAVPSAGEKSLKDFIEFIKLDDLKPEIYQELLNEKAKAIQRYLLGSTLVVGVDGNSGNRALGEVHKEQQKYKIESKVKKIRDWIQKLIEIDATLYGYDANKFYFKFVDELNEDEMLALEEKRAKVIADKVNYIVKINEGGYAFTKEKIAEMLGVEISDLVEVEKPVSTSEFAKSKKKLNLAEIRRKRELTEKNQIKFEKFINDNFDSWQKDVLKAVKEKIEKVKDIKDLLNADYDYPETLQDMMTISHMQGFENTMEVDSGIKEFAKSKTTKVLNAALDSFLKKNPAMYEDIEDTLEFSRAKYFWIKKSTDITITEKIMKHFSNSLEKGTTFKQWKQDVDNTLAQSGLDLKEGYLKTVFRTNMNHAYNAGKYQKMVKFKDTWPYYQYTGILDGREQSHTKELDGKIFKVGTTEADKYYPPNGYNCRCYTISLTADEVDENDVVGSGDISDEMDLGTFAGNVGNDEYIKTLEKKYNEKIKSFSEKYNIPDFILAKPLKKNKSSDIIVVEKEIFKEAKTIKEANEYAINILGIKADYKGVDIRCANEWNKGIFEMKQLFPEVVENLKFIGSIQGRNSSIKKELTKYYTVKIYEKYKDLYSEQVLQTVVKEKVDEMLELIKPKKSTMAVSLSVPKRLVDKNPEYGIIFEHSGISMNKTYFQDYDFVKMDKTKQINEKWKPIGTNNVKGTFDHEFGHQLDKFLNLRNDEEIDKIYKQLVSNNSFREKLSGYSQTSKAEMIAEAWSEYMNNPEPREIAKKVGKRVEFLWQQYKKKK